MQYKMLPVDPRQIRAKIWKLGRSHRGLVGGNVSILVHGGFWEEAVGRSELMTLS